MVDSDKLNRGVASTDVFTSSESMNHNQFKLYDSSNAISIDVV